MLRLNTMLIKRGFHKPYISKDYWTNLKGISVYRSYSTVMFVDEDPDGYRPPIVKKFDRKDKEGVLRHIHSLEVEK